MKHLSQISHDIFAQFYTGSNGARKVNCILDDNSVRFIVFENGKKKRVREFSNCDKAKCLAEAEKALNN